VDLGAQRARASEVTKVSDSFVDEFAVRSIICPDDCQLRTICSLFAVDIRLLSSAGGQWAIRFDSSFRCAASASEVERSSAVQCIVHCSALHSPSWPASCGVEARGHEWTTVAAHLTARSVLVVHSLLPRRPWMASSADASRSAPACPWLRQ